MKAVQTGMLWVLKKDLTTQQLENIKVSYRYVNPKDESVFETFIELQDKIGVPSGDSQKVTSILGNLEVQDRRIAPKFKVQKKSKLKLRDYQETAMDDIDNFLNEEDGTCFNLSGEPGCVDKDTEFLTPTGWKKISEYVDSDEVFEVDKKMEGVFSKPIGFIDKHCDIWYDFITHKDKTLMRLSGEHIVPYITSKGNLFKRRASELYDSKPIIRIPSNFTKLGGGLDYTDDEIRLIVAIAADGSYYNTKNPTNKFRVNLKKERKKGRLRTLLKALPDVTYREDKKDTGYSVFVIDSPSYIKSLTQLWGANQSQLEIISNEIVYWDGRVDKRTGNKNFFTCIKEEADFVQFVFSSTTDCFSTIDTRDRVDSTYQTGNKTYTRKSIEYEVRETTFNNKIITPKKSNGKGGNIVKVQAKLGSRKYCFTTSTGMWLARKNGFVFVTGNSGKSFMLANLLAKLGIKTLIIAHLSSLTKQLQKEMYEVLGYEPKILTKDTEELGDINIATSQLISKNPHLWYLIKKGIGCLVVDEAESLGSMTTMRIFQRAYAKYHIFISATFTRSVDQRTPALLDFAGHKQVTLRNPKLLKPSVIYVQCPERFYPPMSTYQYQKAKGTFYAKPSLDDKVVLITKGSVKKGRQVLIACDVIEVQERLKERLATMGIKSECFNSKTPENRRDEALKDYDEGKIQVLIGFGVLNAGLSIPRISTIIRLATPSSPEKLDQLIGRSRRDFDGKEGAWVIDLVFPGFGNDKRLQFYRRKVRQDAWLLHITNWEKFARRL